MGTVVGDFEFLLKGFIAASKGSKILYDLKSQIGTVNIGKFMFALFLPSELLLGESQFEKIGCSQILDFLQKSGKG
ncbi:hypothetical protein NSTC745_05969 [Nostoc sp. DSM 114161]|jgi:hypothetical protein